MAKTRQLQVKTPRPVKKVHIYKSSLQKCSFCQRALICKKSRSIAQGRLFSSESITAIASQAKYCPKCRLYMRCNFVWLGGQKINCMTFNQLQKSGLYFVTSTQPSPWSTWSYATFVFCVPRLALVKRQLWGTLQMEIMLKCSGVTPCASICCMPLRGTQWPSASQIRLLNSTLTFRPRLWSKSPSQSCSFLHLCLWLLLALMVTLESIELCWHLWSHLDKFLSKDGPWSCSMSMTVPVTVQRRIPFDKFYPIALLVGSLLWTLALGKC